MSGPAGLFEVLKLPRPVEHQVVVNDAPAIEPLARIGAGEPWWVVLVDRRRARLLAGTRDGLVELWRVDHDTKGQHEQGGWSQARYQRSVDKEAKDHLNNASEELLRRHKRRPFDALFVGAPEETEFLPGAKIKPDMSLIYPVDPKQLPKELTGMHWPPKG